MSTTALINHVIGAHHFFLAGLTDTFEHGWDLAKATGQSTDLAPELASALLEQSAPDGACPADQLAAFLGRVV